MYESFNVFYGTSIDTNKSMPSEIREELDDLFEGLDGEEYFQRPYSGNSGKDTAYIGLDIDQFDGYDGVFKVSSIPTVVSETVKVMVAKFLSEKVPDKFWPYLLPLDVYVMPSTS